MVALRCDANVGVNFLSVNGYAAEDYVDQGDDLAFVGGDGVMAEEIQDAQ